MNMPQVRVQTTREKREASLVSSMDKENPHNDCGGHPRGHASGMEWIESNGHYVPVGPLVSLAAFGHLPETQLSQSVSQLSDSALPASSSSSSSSLI